MILWFRPDAVIENHKVGYFSILLGYGNKINLYILSMNTMQ
jgi:hypothetical protein